jgi:hypothetical protein
MVSLINRLGLVLVLVTTLSACGGTTSNTEGTGGAAGTGGSSGVGGSTTSSSCDVVSATVAQLQVDPTAVACVKSSCSANLVPCMGTNYSQNDFGTSPCAPYANCVSACNCVSSCSSNCIAPSACLQCLSNNVLACAVTHCM